MSGRADSPPRPPGAALLPLAALLAGCGEAEETPQPAPTAVAGRALPPPGTGPWIPPDFAAGLPAAGAAFPDEALARGLDSVNVSGRPEKPTILEATGAGVALFDLGGDGDLDVVFAQGLAGLEDLVDGPGADVELFRNDSTGRFERADGPGLSGWWTGLAVGDLDGDALDDVVVAGFGDMAVLLQEPGEGLAPLDRTGIRPRGAARIRPGREREAGAIPRWASSVALFDANQDGALDLYVGCYLELDPLAAPPPAGGEGEPPSPCLWKGLEVFCGPGGLVPQPDITFHGRPDGRFVDTTGRWLPGQVPGPTLGVAPFDADADGDTDLFVARDGVPSLLLVNEIRSEARRFVDRGAASGLVPGPAGRSGAQRGVGVGDVDRNGFLDLAVTGFSDEPTRLLLGGAAGFEGRTEALGLADETGPLLSWGVHLEDFDGDGWPDLFTANGHVHPRADGEGTGTRYGQPDTLWRLLPTGRARRVWPTARDSILFAEQSSRGSAVGDVDGDGAPDLVLVSIDGPCVLGINRLDPRANRLAVLCRGPAPNAPSMTGRRTPVDAKGTRVVVEPVFPPGTPPARRRPLVGEVQTSRGFQSASSPWLHFGLGDQTRYGGLTVTWPSGERRSFPGGEANRAVVIHEREGIVFQWRLRR